MIECKVKRRAMSYLQNDERSKVGVRMKIGDRSVSVSKGEKSCCETRLKGGIVISQLEMSNKTPKF
jgi:hypothetical protein